jgi:hypothetical protein
LFFISRIKGVMISLDVSMISTALGVGDQWEGGGKSVCFCAVYIFYGNRQNK